MGAHRIAALQMRSGVEPAANLAALEGLVAEATAAGAQYLLSPEVTVNSSRETPEQSVDKIWATLERLGLVTFDRSALAH